MHSLSRDVTDCPEGYRRYVYRVNVSVPFKEQFRQEPGPTLFETLEDRLHKALGTRVELKRRGRGGRLIIHFSSSEQLQSICDRIIGKRVKASVPFKEQFRQEPGPTLFETLEDRLHKALGTRVELKRHGRGGRLIIHFPSDTQLQSICNRIIGE